MANQLYGQRGLSSIYTAAAASAATTTTSSRSAIDSTSFLSAPYLPTFPDPHSHSTDPSPPSLFSLSDPTPSTFGDSFRSTANIPGLVAAASAGSRGIASAAATATSTALWKAFDVSSALAKRPFEALYDKSVVGAQMLGQSEAWLASDSLAKRPRLESTSDLPIYPQRPGEKDCAHYMLTRTCKFGYNCKFDHPVWVPAGGMPDWKELPPVPPESHPERPGEPDCPYFLKTKSCKFGLNCKFNHPKELGTSGNSSDLPERPSEPPCSFYMKTGKCKFGAACKFHHPKDIPIPLETGSVEQTYSVVDVGMISDSNAVKPFTSSSAAASYNSKGLPIRLGETDCPFYMKTSSCKYGANCRYNHPDRKEFYTPFSVVNSPAASIGHSLLSSPFGLVYPAASVLQTLGQTMFGLGLPAVYPQRPGQIECDYYMKSGECKFGERCKFHHPVNRSASKLTLAGLPRREGVLQCPYYMKTGTCSYGASCKFDHPPPGEVMAAVTGKETFASAVEEGKLHVESVSLEEGKKNEDITTN